LTSLRASIDGFEVDHVFPFKWMTTGSWRGPDLNGIWNLVLAHRSCNRDEWFRNPNDDEISRSIARNDAIAESPKPLRHSLEITMNAVGPRGSEARRQFVKNVQSLTTTGRRS
jgi:hypothetical protein